MGYTTDFTGHLDMSRSLSQTEADYIRAFNEVRHMRRDVNKLHEVFKGNQGNPFATTIEEIYGREGEYFVGNESTGVLDHNEPPGSPARMDDWSAWWDKRQSAIKNGDSLPGLWCQWTVNREGDRLEWDGGEKFYNYVEWLQYLINHFFEKWGVKLNGHINWSGEDRADVGRIVVKDNQIQILTGKTIYG
jgi:hypothetical protein